MATAQGGRCTVEVNRRSNLYVAEPCGQVLTEIQSEGGERLGWRCAAGHVVPLVKFARHRCRSCGSRTRYQHYRGCKYVMRVTDALYKVWLTGGGCVSLDDEGCEQIQRLLEPVLAVDDLRIGSDEAQ